MNKTKPLLTITTDIHHHQLYETAQLSGILSALQIKPEKISVLDICISPSLGEGKLYVLLSSFPST